MSDMYKVRKLCTLKPKKELSLRRNFNGKTMYLGIKDNHNACIMYTKGAFPDVRLIQVNNLYALELYASSLLEMITLSKNEDLTNVLTELYQQVHDTIAMFKSGVFDE